MSEPDEFDPLPQRSSGPRRTQAERRAESDHSLLLAAAELIAEEGFNAATFEKVGARAGYSRGLASQRFGSKNRLIEALIDYLYECSEELVFAEGLGGTQGLDAILASVDIYMRNFETEQAIRAYFVCMAGAVSTLSPQRAVFAASHMKVKEHFALLLREGQAMGTISTEIDADAAALMIGSLIIGVSTQWLIDPTTDLVRIRQTTLTALRRSLGV